jgi:hypothetical protein
VGLAGREEKRREEKGGKYEKFALEFLGHILGQDELKRRARYMGEGSRSRSWSVDCGFENCSEYCGLFLGDTSHDIKSEIVN